MKQTRDATVAVTGVSATGSAATLTPSNSVAPTGVSATGAVGTLTVGTTSVAKRLDGGWEVIYHLGRDARSQWAVTRLELRPAANRPVPEGGVTMELIRGITIDAARRYARTHVLHPTPVRGQGTTRRQALKRYAELVKIGHPNAPKTVAAEFQINRSTVRSWIYRANETPDSARRSAHRL